MTTTIQRVWVAPYPRQLKAPLAWGSGHVMPTLEHVLVGVALSDGALGIAEANPRPTIYGETPESIEAVIRREIAPQLLGQPLMQVADIAAATARYALLKNNNSARAAVDMALWSALAQSQGLALAELLNATQPRVRVSYILGTGETEAVLQEAAEVYAAGVRVLKVKVGKDFPREYALLQALYAQFEGLACYIDANECYNPAQAAEYLPAFAALGVLYCEEPLPVNSLLERQALRAAGHLPLISDDSCFTRADLERELVFDSFDILNIKPPRNGFTDGRAMLARVREVGKGAMLGSQASSMLGCLYTLIFAAQTGVDHPSEGTFWLKVQDEPTLPLTDGYASLTDLSAMLRGITPSLTRHLKATDDSTLYWNSPQQHIQVQQQAESQVLQMMGLFGHEVRAKLNAVIGFSQLMRRVLSMDAPIENEMRVQLADDVVILQRYSHHILNMLNNVQDYAKLHAGKLQLARVPLNPAELLAALEQERLQHPSEHPATVRFFGGTVLPALVGDERRLLQILGALIDNAAKAYPSNAAQREVHVSVSAALDAVVFRVQDWGDGIPPLRQAQIRERALWYGSNLLLAYQLLDALGGQLWFESEHGKGSIFYVAMPLAAISAP